MAMDMALSEVPGDERLVALCRTLRRRILGIAMEAGAAHIAPAYSVLEIVVTLYFKTLRLNPADPRWPERDRFILSKGHGCLAQYVVLAERGFFPRHDLSQFTKPGSIFGGHPDRKIPGVETATGSLGHGPSVAAGIALASKLDGDSYRSVVVLSDGECQEGSVWEAAMLATHRGLDNLLAVVDHNKLQSLGPVADVMSSPTSLAEKWRVFGWEVVEVEDHDVGALERAFSEVPFTRGRPSAVIAHTVKGRGVSFMEGSPIWHYRVPNREELALAWKELGGEEAE